MTKDKKSLETRIVRAEDIMKSEQPIIEKGELAQAFDIFDNDTVDTDTNMSTIDFNARLNRDEINASIIFDEFVRLKILPEEFGLTRQKKRLSVSLDGKGREEKRDIVIGQREHQREGGFIKKMFQRN